MDKKFFTQNMIKLEHAYLGWKITNSIETMNLWYDYFKGVPATMFEKAVDEFAMTSRYQPTIAGLMDIITKYGEETMLEASQAWTRALKGIFSAGHKNVTEYAEGNKLQLNDPEVQALKRVGIGRIKKSMEKELPYLFNEFKATYDKERKQKARTVITQMALENKGQDNIKQLGGVR